VERRGRSPGIEAPPKLPGGEAEGQGAIRPRVQVQKVVANSHPRLQDVRENGEEEDEEGEEDFAVSFAERHFGDE
jgi:hypothetical protein